MPLDHAGKTDAERWLYNPKGPSEIFKHKRYARKYMRAHFRPLTDEEILACIKTGIRVHDKQRGIYTHGQ